MDIVQSSIDKLKINQQKVISLRDELQNLTKPKAPSLKCVLREYGNRILILLRDIDSEIGEYQIDRRREILRSLEELMDIQDHLLNSAFKTNRTKFVALMNDYSQVIRHEFIEIKKIF